MEPNSIIAFSEWMADRARNGGRIAIVMKGEQVAVSDGTGWQAGVIPDPDAPLAQVLRMHLMNRNGLELVTRDIPGAVTALSYLCGLDPKELSERFVGDLTSLSVTTGIEYPEQTPLTADATTAIVIWNSVEGQKPPAYLANVAVPWQRLNAYSGSVIPAKRWRVSYPELLTRVIAFYSHESVLIREAQSNDMLSRLTTALQVVREDADHDFAYACLRLCATGYDREFYEARFGEPPEVTNEGLDMIIPTVRAMVMTEYQDSVSRGYAKTLYGRRMPIKSQSIAEVLWFILGGSVQDILTVAQVTFANNGGYVVPSVWRSDAEHIRLIGDIAVRDEPDFVYLLAQLAPLTAPLVPVPLNPTVVVE